ncbi:MAG: PPE domain-containing protein [Gordonia sp. (in: high G+C Gram-positive bacteria)]|uniref:PPE domain-containing protein n=1 Tax=Gordonia sp. (in: high G+C Gram-positive bacteria) TaxID=84139 RepID=UPI0039E2CDEE
MNRPGFTGVDWSSRSPEHLCTRLLSGPGPALLADCAAGWADLVDDLAELVSTARRIVDKLRAEWDSPGAVGAAGAVARLPEWLDALRRQAVRECDSAQTAMAAIETARLVMPAAAAVDDARARWTALTESVGIGALMTGGLAGARRALDEQSATAARVMADYERDVTAVATGSRQRLRPPELVRAPAPAARGTAAAGGAVVLPRVLGGFQPVIHRSGTGPVLARRATVADNNVGVAAGTGGTAPVAPMTGAGGLSARGGTAIVAPAASPHVAAAPGEGADRPITWAQLADAGDPHVDLGHTEGLGAHDRAL